jgi:microcystin-dependent protein
MCTSRNPYGYGCPRLPACSTYLTGPTGATGPTGETGIPVGTILPYGGATAPDGYFLCDGAAKVNTAWPALYAVIGYAFGVGAPGEFLLPAMGGRVPVGAGAGALLVPLNLADDGGDETVTLDVTQMPSHDHELAAVIIPVLASVDVSSGSGTTVAQDNGSVEAAVDNVSNGGGLPHPNMQPYLAVNYIIKY